MSNVRAAAIVAIMLGGQTTLAFAEERGRRKMAPEIGLPSPVVLSDPSEDLLEAPLDIECNEISRDSKASDVDREVQSVSFRISDDEVVEYPSDNVIVDSDTDLQHERSEFVGSLCDEYSSGICRDPGWPRKPCLTKPGDRDRGDCPPLRYRMNDHSRAGKPLCYHRFSKPSITSKYSAGWVGGGTPCFGRSQCASEGTWGLDYGGLFGHAKVWLRWTKHDRNQGGEGAYKTDGRTKLVGLLKR